MTIEELEAYDPHAPLQKYERRFCCPFCGDSKWKDSAHRSLAVKMETGEYICHRCHTKGRLDGQDWHSRVFRPRRQRRPRPDTYLTDDDAPPEPRGTREPRSMSEPLLPREPNGQSEPSPTREPHQKSDDWRKKLRQVVHLAGTEGEAYLIRRGLMVGDCEPSGVRYHPDWYGRPAVLFPIRDREGVLVAVQGRYFDGEYPKTRTRGEARLGVFSAVQAWSCKPTILVEGPIDALSLAAAGYPAIAAMGCHLAEWVGEKLAHQPVLVASDNDRPDRRGISAGNVAGYRWGTELREHGCELMRLSPPEGMDWNDCLKLGREALAGQLVDLIEPWLTAMQTVATMGVDTKVVLV